MFYLHGRARAQRCFTSVFPALCCGLLLLLSGCANPLTPGAQATSTSTGSYTCASHSSTPVTLTMYYGSEKQAWMTDVVAAFNQQKISACDGPITVHAVPYGSG